MSGTLHLGRVDQLRVRLTYSRVLEGPAHDVFLLDVQPKDPTERFDEAPYLEMLEPVLHTHGAAPDPCVVHVNRTHRSWTASPGDAEIAIALSTGRATALDHDSTEVVRSAFRKVLEHVDAERTPPLSHHEAIIQARLRVEEAYPEAHADRLAVTDEEHIAARGMWSVGLVLSNLVRFHVLLGFVDGVAHTTHIRRMPGSEIVDSVGTGDNG
jgi:hypothetical protein